MAKNKQTNKYITLTQIQCICLGTPPGTENPKEDTARNHEDKLMSTTMKGLSAKYYNAAAKTKTKTKTKYIYLINLLLSIPYENYATRGDHH